MNSHISFVAVEKRYGAVRALRGVSVEVPQGSVVAVLGPNGAGKSTLFGCLLGTIRATNGCVRVHGRDVADGHRRAFGYVAERVALYPHRSVEWNASFFATLRGVQRTDVVRQLDRVGLREFRERKVRTLSKGLLQRLGLAIAIAGEPELLVLDEPFNGLDPALLEELQRILAAENHRGATLLVSTHTMSAIEPLATHVAVMLDGSLAAHGPIEDLRREHGEQSLERIYHRIAKRRARSDASALPPPPDPLRGGEGGSGEAPSDFARESRQSGHVRTPEEQDAIPPLPRGEGRGEGKRDAVNATP